MTKALLAAMLGTTLMGSAASVDFTYAEPENFLGTQKKENYDVAIFLPAEQFEGFKVTSVKTYLNNRKGVDCYENVKVWLSTELSLDNKKNAPNVGSYDAAISSEGVVSMSLPESYTITDAGIYVGYSFDINTLNTGSKYPVGIGGQEDPNGFFIHSSRTYTKWKSISDTQKCSASIVVTLESETMPEESVAFVEMPTPVYMSLGESKKVDVTLSTMGSAPVKSVEFAYSIGGNDYTSLCQLPQEVPASLGKKFVASLEIAAQDARLNENVEFSVAKVNGVDNKSEKGVKSSNIVVVNQAPVHQALFEEYTGTWCGYCTRGYAALEYISKNYPDFVVAAYHNGDDMHVVNKYPNNVSGLPGAVLDRSLQVDPYYGSEKYMNIALPVVGDILAINDQFTPWAINVSHTWDNDNILTATATVSSLSAVENGKYKIAYILIADGLVSDSWAQSNYYSSNAQSDSQIPELNAFCKGGEFGKSSIKGLPYNDVVILDTGILGVAGSIPSELEAEQQITHSQSFDLSKVNSKIINLIDKNKLRIVAAVLDAKGKALNCAKDEVNDFDGTSVKGVDVSENELPVEYYNLNGVKVSNPSNGIFIRRQGDRTSKVILK